jgi:hypothetical protein
MAHMATACVSHAFDDRVHVDKFVDVVVNRCGLPREQIF